MQNILLVIYIEYIHTLCCELIETAQHIYAQNVH